MNLTPSKNWKTVKLADVAKVNELTITSRYIHDHIEYVDVASVSDRQIQGVQKLTLADAPSRAKRIVRDNDILISTVRPNLKHFCFVKNAKENLIASTGFAVISAKQADPLFLYYYLTSDPTSDYLSKVAEGHTSAYPSFNPSVLEKLEIPVPESVDDQKEIAAILGSLDDKIELLRCENKTLESIAQALFREWFVEFKFPGYEKIKMVDGMPEGWKVGKLEEFCNISIGRTPSRKEEEWFSTNPNDVKWVSIKDMGTCGTYIFNTSEYLTQEAVGNFRIPVIPENTVIISFKMTLGRVAITTEEMLSNEAIAHLKPKDNLSPEFLYLTMKNFDFNSMGSTSSIASAVNSQSIKDMEIVSGNDQVMDLFNQTISPIFEKLKNGSKEIQTLSRLRDDLLNKIFFE